ncbi:unnamed protein product [Gongylonema pulchrum]|uniref:Uncharacterized protein n=1 Tax=Gongylonema pulchrum TaxID=637853 RepID=A0A183EQ94_9BILA|nr:unnamed protein product [Gongylonema pulchrum]
MFAKSEAVSPFRYNDRFPQIRRETVSSSEAPLSLNENNAPKCACGYVYEETTGWNRRVRSRVKREMGILIISRIMLPKFQA